MHELSIATSICAAAAEHAAGSKISSIRVEVGALAGVSVDSLEFCMDIAAQESGIGSPKVAVIEILPLLKCACGAEYEASDLLDGCPSCGGFDRQLVSGADIRITRIETEGEDQ